MLDDRVGSDPGLERGGLNTYPWFGDPRASSIEELTATSTVELVERFAWADLYWVVPKRRLCRVKRPHPVLWRDISKEIPHQRPRSVLPEQQPRNGRS